MRKIIALSMIALDGVIQAPSAHGEDTIANADSLSVSLSAIRPPGEHINMNTKN